MKTSRINFTNDELKTPHAYRSLNERLRAFATT
jgi:hypothetical protein